MVKNKSVAQEKHKSVIGGKIRVYESSGRRSRASRLANSTAMGRGLQEAWQSEMNEAGKALRAGLSLSGKTTLDDINSTRAAGTVDGLTQSYPEGTDGWMDEDDDNTPVETDLVLGAEADEFESLLTASGIRPRRHDARTWAQRIHTRQFKWKLQIEDLADAYLAWKHGKTPVDTIPATFNVEYVDIYDYSRVRELNQTTAGYWNVTLIRHGCLSSAPDIVTSVVSLRTLELYHRLRLRHAQFSIQAFMKVLCDLNHLLYRRSLWRQFTDTFDLYLMILRCVKHRSDREFGRLEPDWRIKNSCPPCQYKLEDEPKLEIDVVGTVDGNESARRVDVREGLQEDSRIFQSNYFMTEAEADVFKFDVKRRAPKKTKNSAVETEPPTWTADVEEASAADGDTNDSTCTDRWKAASLDSMKRMWAIYRESGIFLSACRHGLIWYILDMVRSGELAKYPLAIIDRLIKTFPGTKLGIGYDIACSFTATIRTSSLAQAAANSGLRMAVPAFHGYAHNRRCQLDFHPLYINGFGIDEMEGTERIFSASNSVARLTRHATRFHRHQMFDGHFACWDADKYQELTRFLLNNYKQVAKVLQETPLAMASLQSGTPLDKTDYYQHLESERQYLAARKTEPESSVIASQYITLLLKYSSAQAIFEKIRVISAPRSTELVTRLATAKLSSFEALEQLREMLAAFEELHGIEERWTPISEEWRDAVKYIEIRDYQGALDKLEGLVVQRLFELSKLGLAGTGYKMRVHISKALKTRCKAIQTALRSYNIHATKLGRPVLEWKDIASYGNLAEFTLLREGRADIRAEPWAQAVNRQCAIYQLRIDRANEERLRLDVEIRRIRTSIQDEEIEMAGHITRVQETQPHLAAELTELRDGRVRVNNLHRRIIADIYALSFYTGDPTPGIRMGCKPADNIAMMEVLGGIAPGVADVGDDGEVPGVDEDDVLADTLDSLALYIGNLRHN